MPRHAATRRQHLHRQRPGEAGTILVLVMLAFMVLLVVSVQLRFTSSVEREHAHIALLGARMDLLAQAAARQAESVLLMDVEDAAADEEQGGANPLAGGGGSDSAADVVANSDSGLDEWTNPAALLPSMGDGLQLFVEVVDEDSKFNLLSVFAEDEDLREEAREIVVRLLDVAFEGTAHDIGYGDATDFLDKLEQWTGGDRGLSDQVPVPKQKQTDAQEDESTYTLDTSIFGEDEGQWPLTLGELVHMGALEPVHLEGFVEAGEYFAGLNDLLTITSHLELKAEPEAEDAFTGSPFAGAAGTSGFGSSGVGADAEPEVEVSASSTNTGLVNINTAPLKVLRAIARDHVPLSALEFIVEFREMIEEAEENSLLGGGSLFGDDDEDDSGSDEGGDDGGDDFGGDEGEEEDEDDPSKFVFTDPAEVFQRIENEFRVTVNADDLQRDQFLKWFWVESQVFTVKIMVRDPASGVRRHYRTTFWRMLGSDRPRMITLLPLELYADPRRLEDFPGDLEELSEDRMYAAR